MKTMKEYADALGAITPHKFRFVDLDIVSLDEAYEWVEAQSKDIEAYGEYSEGFVIYKNGKPIAKMKNKDYVDKHHAIGAGDTLHTRNIVIERFFNGTIDDLMGVLVEAMRDYVDLIRDWWLDKVEEHVSLAKEIASHDYEDQKAYALCINEKVDGGFKSFYFCNKEEILAGYSVQVLLNDWIKDNYKKFEKEVKALI